MKTCLRCSKALERDGIAAGESWVHRDCFSCFTCNAAFADGIYYPFEEAGKQLQLLCELDFAKRNNLACAKCGKVVHGKCLSAANNSYHPECFRCDKCDELLQGSSISVRPSGKYCKNCVPIIRETEKYSVQAKQQAATASNKFGTISGTQRNTVAANLQPSEICHRCHKPFQTFADIVQFENKPHHGFHFACGLCRKEVDRTGKQWEDEMFCGNCYEKVSNAICAACGQNIKGRSVTAMGLQFHPEHFVCVRCLKSFPGGEYFELEGEPYCKQHYHEARGDLCGRCFIGPVGQVIVALNRKWCEGHFRCFGCDKDLASRADASNSSAHDNHGVGGGSSERVKFMECDERPYCKRCYDSVPFGTRKNLIKYEKIERKAFKMRTKAAQVI